MHCHTPHTASAIQAAPKRAKNAVKSKDSTMREQILSDVGMKRVPRSDAYSKSDGASKRGGEGEDGDGEEGAEVGIFVLFFCSF